MQQSVTRRKQTYGRFTTCYRNRGELAVLLNDRRIERGGRCISARARGNLELIVRIICLEYCFFVFRLPPSRQLALGYAVSYERKRAGRRAVFSFDFIRLFFVSPFGTIEILSRRNETKLLLRHFSKSKLITLFRFEFYRSMLTRRKEWWIVVGP